MKHYLVVKSFLSGVMKGRTSAEVERNDPSFAPKAGRMVRGLKAGGCDYLIVKVERLEK